MDSERPVKRLLLAAIAVAGGATLHAQTGPVPGRDANPAATMIEIVDVELVNVEVVVTDRDGKPVSGLTREDFEVVDGGLTAPISHFAAFASGAPDLGTTAGAEVEPAPLLRPRLLGVFVDNSSLPLAGRRRAFEAMARRLEAFEKQGDRVTVVTWDQSLKVRREFSSTRSLSEVFEEIADDAPSGNMATGERRALLRQIEAGAMPGDVGSMPMEIAVSDAKAVGETTRLYLETRRRDAVATIEAMERFIASFAGLEGTKTVFVVTGGMADRAGEEMIEAIENKYIAYPSLRFVHRLDAMHFDTSKRRAQTSAVANAAGVVLNGFVVDSSASLAEDGSGKLRLKELEIERQTAAISGLDRLARATGGLAVGEPTQAGAWLERIAEERRGTYSLGWTAPPSPATADPSARAKGRRLEIRVRRPDVRTRHREFVMPSTRDDRSRSAVLSALMLGETVGSMPFEVRLGESRPAPAKGANANAPAGGPDWDLEVDLEVLFPLADVVLLPGEHFHEGKVRVWVASQDDAGRRSVVSRAELPIRIANQELLTAQGKTGIWKTRLRLRPLPHDIAVGLDDPLGATLTTTRTHFAPLAGGAAHAAQ